MTSPGPTSTTSPISRNAAYSGYGSALPAGVLSAVRIAIASMEWLRLISQQLLEDIGPDVAAADDAHDRGAGRRGDPAGDQGGEAGGARRFGDELASLDQQPERIGDLGVTDPHHLVDEVLDVPEGVLTSEGSGEAIGDGGGIVQVRGCALRQAPAHRVGSVWLYSHDPDSWILELDGRGDAGDQAAPADRDDDHGDVWDLPEDLKPYSPLAGHDRQVIERMDQHEIPLRLQGQACLQQAAAGP